MIQQVGHELVKYLNIAKCEVICLGTEKEVFICRMEISIQ